MAGYTPTDNAPILLLPQLTQHPRLMTTARAAAISPLLLFILLFVGTGAYFNYLGVEFAFYQLPAPVAIIPAIMLAIFLAKEPLNDAIERLMRGIGQPTVVAMCLIYLLAGAFASVATSMGAVDATVNLGVTLIPSSLILPGVFIVSGIIATAMGTSMGTIGAVAPVALALAQATGIDPIWMAGSVLSGAIFGDNLSIISDTTIAATRTQGCEMRDKFKENVKMALPAALIAAIVFYLLASGSEQAPTEPLDIIKTLPYFAILIMALMGINVFVVLTCGTLFAAAVAFATIDYSMLQWSKDIYKGFTNMQEIFLLSMLIGGLGALMQHQGGLAFVEQSVLKMTSKLGAAGKRGGELAIAGLVALTNLCTANNTVAILVASDVAKHIANDREITPRRSASLLDIFSCIVQGLIPWGAQMLLLGSIFAISPISIVGVSIYPMILAIVATLFVVLRKQA